MGVGTDCLRSTSFFTMLMGELWYDHAENQARKARYRADSLCSHTAARPGPLRDHWRFRDLTDETFRDWSHSAPKEDIAT